LLGSCGLLCVHEGIADHVIAMIQGRSAELVLAILPIWPPTSALVD
jgi:delta 1-pyrroline-5-carboxylate dehydrogenase